MFSAYANKRFNRIPLAAWRKPTILVHHPGGPRRTEDYIESTLYPADFIMIKNHFITLSSPAPSAFQPCTDRL